MRLHGDRRPRRAARAARATGRGPSGGARTSRRTSRSSPSTATRRCTSRSPRTPGSSASAGTCTRSSSCATASRCTATCARSSSRSTATSASLLTPEAIEYLRRYGPVGCRDWTTVYLLLSCGVPAFFSGCVTTTIDTRLPGPAPLRRRPARRSPTSTCPPTDVPAGAVDVRAQRPRSGGARSSPTSAARSSCSRPTGSRHSAVVTSRLHCYLPVRSLGVPAEFRPEEPLGRPLRRADRHRRRRVRRDPRGPARASSSRSTRAILTGRPEAEVYALWRELTAADVARRRGAQDAPAAAPAGRARDRATSCGARSRGPVAHGTPRGRRGALRGRPAARAAGARCRRWSARCCEHASRPLHLWVLARPGTGGVEQRLGRALPAAQRQPGADPRARARSSRLALAGPAPGRRAASSCCRSAAAAAGDVAELAALDLGGHAVGGAAAARPARAASA